MCGVSGVLGLVFRVKGGVQGADHLQPLLASVEPAVVLEAASSVLALARVCGGELGAAPNLAFGALLDLWDTDATGTAHPQLMDVLSANLGVLHVRAAAASVLSHVSHCNLPSHVQRR